MPDGASFLESLARQYAAFGATKIIVVLNKDGFSQIKYSPLELPTQTEFVINHQPEAGRFSSVKCGLEKAGNNWVFIHNIDNPYANRSVLQQLYRAKSEADVIKPMLNGKGGHPVLISNTVWESILNEKNNDCNLKTFLAGFEGRNVNVNDYSVLLNLNTHAEYLDFYRG